MSAQPSELEKLIASDDYVRGYKDGFEVGQRCPNLFKQPKTHTRFAGDKSNLRNACLHCGWHLAVHSAGKHLCPVVDFSLAASWKGKFGKGRIVKKQGRGRPRKGRRT